MGKEEREQTDKACSRLIPFYTTVALACDQGQDFLSESDDDAARKGQKTIRPLGRVVGF